MSPRPFVRSRRGPIAVMLSAAAPLLFAGCVSDKAKVAEPPATCSKAGDTCTFSPGKLGLCVESANGSATLICQSQH